MVTALFGIIDPESGLVTYACAGHPAPVLALPDGSTSFLPKDGVPLGIIDRVDASDWTFTLPPGARFVLYTDGLIEYDRDVLGGEALLLRAVRESVSVDEAEPARALLGRIFPTARSTDDVATLTISVRDVARPAFAFTFTGVPMAVPLVRRSLDRFAARIGLDADSRFAVLTAAGEALANSVEHAYAGILGLVRVHAEAVDGVLHVVVEDDGRWKPAQRRDERGRGLPMMRALMDGVEIRTHQARTEVRLTMRLPGEPAP
jgi:anti-sigma regulatory factor (Ser/Thr protein kinase)